MEIIEGTRLTKKHYACYVIMNAGRPLTRLETMGATHTLQALVGCKVSPFMPTSNVSYWLTRVPLYCRAARSSFIVQGLVQKAGKRGRTILYDLTPEGRKLALSAQDRIRRQAAEAGEIDWRPTESTPEDNYAL